MFINEEIQESGIEDKGKPHNKNEMIHTAVVGAAKAIVGSLKGAMSKREFEDSMSIILAALPAYVMTPALTSQEFMSWNDRFVKRVAQLPADTQHIYATRLGKINQ